MQTTMGCWANHPYLNCMIWIPPHSCSSDTIICYDCWSQVYANDEERKEMKEAK